MTNHETPNSPLLLTTAEAAKMLKVSTRTLIRWRDLPDHPLRPVRIGSIVRYRLDDVRTWVESQAT